MFRHILKSKAPLIYTIYIYFDNIIEFSKKYGTFKSFGLENPDKIFLIIKLENPNLGLMAIYNCVLGYLRYADQKCLIPVVDLKNFKNGYLENNEVGSVNAWEYFFEQTSKYKLEEVYRSKNVIIASGFSPREASPITLNFILKSKKKSEYYFNLIEKHLIIKQTILQDIDIEWNDSFFGKRIIGISSRGSDMINLRGHARQPDINNLILITKMKLSEWKCDYVFLASEENHVVSLFQESFGNKLLTNKSNRINSSFFENHYLPLVNMVTDRPNNKYLNGKEYLSTVLILSRCNCLIGSLVGKTVGAILMNKNNYENKYIYDLGVYN